MPNRNRPSDSWSKSATWLATVTGWWWGMLMTPVPKRIERVSRMSVARKISGEAICSTFEVKCSPIQASE